MKASGSPMALIRDLLCCARKKGPGVMLKLCRGERNLEVLEVGGSILAEDSGEGVGLMGGVGANGKKGAQGSRTLIQLYLKGGEQAMQHF